MKAMAKSDCVSVEDRNLLHDVNKAEAENPGQAGSNRNGKEGMDEEIRQADAS